MKYVLYYSQAIASPRCSQLYPSVFSKDLLGREGGRRGGGKGGRKVLLASCNSEFEAVNHFSTLISIHSNNFSQSYEHLLSTFYVQGPTVSAERAGMRKKSPLPLQPHQEAHPSQ